MTYETAQYQLLFVFEAPWVWALWVLVLTGLLLPAVGMVIWRAKQQVDIPTLEWSFRERDVTPLEFKNMTRQYAKDYQYLVSRVDYPLALLAISVGVTLVGAPILLMRTNAFVISITPIIAGFLMMVFGVLVATSLFRSMPGPLSDEFPPHSYRRMRRGLSQIGDLPGTSWVGVRLTIGESHGYFTIRSPRPEVRIEDIESVARIECETDRTGNITSASAVLEVEDGREETVAAAHSDVNRLELTLLVKRLLEAYVQKRGEESYLDEIQEEVQRAIDSLKRTD